MGVGREGFASQKDFEMEGDNIEVFSSIRYLGICFSKARGPQEDKLVEF